MQSYLESKGLELDTEAAASLLDSEDPFNSFRDRFHVPKKNLGNASSKASSSESSIYLCGNSLGLQPKRTRELVLEELDEWSNRGVEGHFTAKRPWLTIDDFVVEQSARIVGGLPKEVTVMNSLTVNLHLMMLAFYRPTKDRFKILVEQQPFPSDLYATQSQVSHHGYDPTEGVLKLPCSEGLVTTQQVLDLIESKGEEIALVLLPGVQYYSGQVFDMKTITEAAHKKGCVVGWDLAHAVGNVPLKMHDWDVDFACWCSYKYLNSGPGCIAGCFVHEKHTNKKDLKQAAGWWGHDLKTRFDMDVPEFHPIDGAHRFRLSNPPVLPVVQLLASLELFEEAGGVEELRKKSVKLTGYLEELLNKHFDSSQLDIITPSDPNQRGCQLSLSFKGHNMAKKIQQGLEEEGVVCDVRKPCVIRIAPTPLYNTFTDVLRFVKILSSVLSRTGKEGEE